MVLDVDFMTLNILKLDLFIIIIFIFLECIMNLRAPLQKFEEKDEFYVIVSYFELI